MPTHICPNCDNQFTGQFCNNCGQKLSHRITMGHIGHDLVHAFTHTDKGFFHLMIQLFKKPGKVAREYIVEEKRKRYGTPFQYIIIIGTIATFVVINSHFMENMMRAMGAGTQDAASRQAVALQKITDLQSRYYNFLILLQLPFMSISTFWLYKKYKFNYAEHLTLHTFITAQTTLISMILMLFMFIMDKSNVNIMRSFTVFVGLASFVYHIIMYMQFFLEKTFKGFLKALAAYLLGLVIFFVVVMVLSITGGIIYAAFFAR